MRHGSIPLLLVLAVIGGCGPRATDREPTVTTANTDEARNAAFWKDVANIHFSEDRSHRGERLPTARLADAAGRPTTLAARRGKPVLVNFWAHWCVPCRAEMPTIDAMAAKRGAHIQVVAVNEDIMQPSRASLGRLSMAPVIARLVDPGGELGKSIAGEGLPTTVLYGSDGRERWRLMGVLDWTKPQAQKLLDEAI